MELLNRCLEKCQADPPKIMLPDSHDRETLLAARELCDRKLAVPVLIGGPVELRQFAVEHSVSTRGIQIFHPMHRSEFDAYVHSYMRLRRHKHVNAYEAGERLRLPLYFSAMMLKDEGADLCLAGNVSNASSVIRPGIEILRGDERSRTVSGVTLLVEPETDKILLFSDTAVTPEPTSEGLSKIALNCVEILTRLTDEEPKIAMLSFSTKGSAEHEQAERVKSAVGHLRKKAPGLKVEGEIQFDAAFTKEVGDRKAPGNILNGQANIYIFPSLNSANIGYKIAGHLAGYHIFGPFFQGLSRSYHGLQGGCPAEKIVETALIAAYLHKHQSG